MRVGYVCAWTLYTYIRPEGIPHGRFRHTNTHTHVDVMSQQDVYIYLLYYATNAICSSATPWRKRLNMKTSTCTQTRTVGRLMLCAHHQECRENVIKLCWVNVIGCIYTCACIYSGCRGQIPKQIYNNISCAFNLKRLCTTKEMEWVRDHLRDLIPL